MAMQVILLERVDSLGNLGDVVSVKPGYARNYLIPQSKALRATKDNIAYFESRKKDIEKQNEAKKKEAEKLAGSFDKLTVSLIRLASEDGSLYGSVSSRDIAEAVTKGSKHEVTRNMVTMTQNYKQLGLFPVTIALHPEVKVDVTINIARSEEEAKIQLKTGKALIAEDESKKAAAPEAPAVKENLMDAEALAAEAEEEAEELAKAAKKAEKSAKKSQDRAAKKAVSAEEGGEDAADEE